MDVRRLYCCICIVWWLQGSNGWTLLVISSNWQNIKPRVQKNDADIVWGRWTSDVQRKNNKCHFENQPVVLIHCWFIALCCNTTCWISPPPRWRVPSRRSCFPNLRPKGHHPSFSRKRMKEIWDYSPPVILWHSLLMIGLYPCCWLFLQVLCMLFPVLVALPSGSPLGLSCRRSLESKDWTESFFSKNEATC